MCLDICVNVSGTYLCACESLSYVYDMRVFLTSFWYAQLSGGTLEGFSKQVDVYSPTLSS